MAYKALYRKWRPEVFEEVIGQSQIIRTLKNQVQTENISHAYMFSGIRGTGKTSTAKIFARSINCLNPHEGDPCNVCEACRSILSEQMMDVLEIDAASNNGVDHIRELRESVKYPPVKGRYKVYIIDEVHMLSTGAFNALLKTLEEPPDHVVFILATTELHKIPATVLSRCLRFTFKPLGLDEISERLVTICRSLGIEYEEAAITTIALNGEGALRDALSILDQCLAYNPGELRYDQVTDVLGSINEALLFKLAAHIGNHEPLEAVKLVQELYLDGKDLKQLVTDTMKHFRWLLMASLNAAVEGWGSLPESTREQFLIQSKRFSTENLTSIIRQLADTEYLMKRSAQPQLMLENNLIALCAPQQPTGGHVSAGRQEHQSSELKEINERIGRIEQFLNRARSKKTQAVQSPPIQEPVKMKEPEQKKAGMKASEPASADLPPDSQELKKAEPVPNNALSFEALQKIWPHVIDQMREDKKVSIQAMAKEARLESFSGNELTLAFLPEQTFLCERMGREDIKAYIAGLIQQKTGRLLRLALTVSAPAGTVAEGNSEKTEATLRRIVPEAILDITEES